VNRNRPKIQSVDRALTLLEILAGHVDGIGLSDIAREAGLNKTTVYRLLATMQGRGYVRQLPEGGRYTLGWKVVELSGALLEGTELVTVAKDPLKRLSQLTQEAVHLGVLDEDRAEVIYVSKIDSPQPIRIASRVGGRMPAFCTALGKSILSHMAPERAERILRKKPLLARTSKTKTDLELVIRELDTVRSRGYALDNGENEEGIVCIGAPIFDNSGNVSAAVSISGPSFRLQGEIISQMAPHVVRCAEEISMNLGCDRHMFRALLYSSQAHYDEVEAKHRRGV